MSVLAQVMKIERERKIVLAALCSDALKQRMLAELDARLKALEAEPEGSNGGAGAVAPAGSKKAS